MKMFSKDTYINRRRELCRRVGEGLILLLGNDESGSNYADNAYAFRQDSSFLYFFGLGQAGLSAVIDAGSGSEVIFGDELTIDAIIWMGTQPSLRERCELCGVRYVRPLSELQTYMEDTLRLGRPVHYLPVYRAEHSLKLWKLLGVYPGTEQPSEVLIRAIVDLRNHKTAEELAEIDRACEATAEMHLAMMRMVRPGIRECEVSAVVESIAYARNYRLSFPTIATIHGETLHNHDHSHEIKSGDLFLLDAGAETEMGYAGDMSTTVPADATFTTRQREMHELQQLCQSAAVQALRPGIRFEEIYDLSARVLVEGLIGIGLMKGDAVSAVQEGAHALFYPHGLGHMMGLDVHDMENLGERYVGYEPDRSRSTQFGRRSLRLARELEVGFVLTIEPGIYFIPELIDLWSSEGRHASFINYEKVLTYRDFGGIRNEEDYVITESGYRLLGKKIPKASLNIERRRI